MWTDALLAYIHFAAIFAMIWFLSREWTLLRTGAGAVDVERIARADAGYGALAVVVVLSGALRAAYGLKGWAFYVHNPAFHLKITLFVLVGLLSILPTLAFLRWRRVPETEWRAARRWILVELHLLALIPLAAVVMARGMIHG